MGSLGANNANKFGGKYCVISSFQTNDYSNKWSNSLSNGDQFSDVYHNIVRKQRLTLLNPFLYFNQKIQSIYLTSVLALF